MKDTVRKAKQKYSSQWDVLEGYTDTLTETVQEPNTSPFNKNNNANFDDSFIKLMDKYREDIKTLTEQYTKEIMEKERQILLLEDSEKRKENEYIQQITELKSKLSKYEAKKWWHLWK